jgi:hypothetical protein
LRSDEGPQNKLARGKADAGSDNAGADNAPQVARRIRQITNNGRLKCWHMLLSYRIRGPVRRAGCASSKTPVRHTFLPIIMHKTQKMQRLKCRQRLQHVGPSFSPDALRLNRISKASGLKLGPTYFLLSSLGARCRVLFLPGLRCIVPSGLQVPDIGLIVHLSGN